MEVGECQGGGRVLKGEVIGGDTVGLVELRAVTVYPRRSFKSRGEAERYAKLVRDVKRVLPYAKLVYGTLLETYEYMETLEGDAERSAHLKRLEKELFASYKPELKRLTLSQGKLLIRLIDRECNQSSYALLRAYLGGFRAGFWNVFAGLFGASLKAEYRPEGKDREVEEVVLLVEQGVL